MTTKSSPLRALKAQADKIAATLKAAERGEKVDVRFAEKIEAARKTENFKVGIVMDDKVVTIEMPWATINSATEAELSDFVIQQMGEAGHLPDLQLILHKERGDFSLYACRGEGRGCKRNLHRTSKAKCDDCYGPLPEDMTVEQVAQRLARGDA